MKARFDWEKVAKQSEKFERGGRKRFEMHKNQHNLVLSPIVLDNGVYKEKIVSKTPEPTSFRIAPRPERNDQSFFYKQLKAKESEILNLKRLYNDTSRKLQIYERASSRSKMRQIVLDISSPIYKRNVTPDYKKNSYLDLQSHPAFIQPKFTKNHPKILLSNPITGISPRFFQ